MFTEKTNDQVIVEWQESVKALASAKDNETALRAQVVERMFKDHKDEGTENVELGNGYKLKAVFKLSYSLNNKDDATDKALTKLEKSGPEGAFVAGRLVKWKPDLSVSEYKTLTAKQKAIIDEVLTVRPGTPSVELVVPKSK